MSYRFQFSSFVILAFGFFSHATARAETVVQTHTGAVNPMIEGWQQFGSSPAVTLTAGDNDIGATGCGSAPCTFWRISDTSGSSGTRGAYRITSFDFDHPGGWAMRARMRRSAFSAGATEAMSFAATMILRQALGGSSSQEYAVLFGVDDGNMLAKTISAAGDVSCGVLGPETKYYDVAVVYNPVQENVDILIDGELCAADVTGRVVATNDTYFAWGSLSSGGRATTHWRSVSFVTDPDSDQDGIADVVERATHGSDPFSADTDGDGAFDGIEIVAGSNPLVADTDGDGLSDGFEIANGLNPIATGDEQLDLDGDGLSNAEEQANGSDPLEADSDEDGIEDGVEVNDLGTNPALADTDGDELDDADEITVHATDPLVSDTDGDGVLDGDEVNTYTTDPTLADTDDDGLVEAAEIFTHGTDPLVADTDGDGLRDGFEVRYGFNPTDGTTDEGAGDPDGDGLTNAEEDAGGSDPHSVDGDEDGLSDVEEINVYLTNPLNPDTDDDGLTDRFEILFALDPLTPGEALADLDGDGLTNLQEQDNGTDPRDQDTDNDGLDDGLEVRVLGTDPTLDNAGQTPAIVQQRIIFDAQDQALFPEPIEGFGLDIADYLPAAANSSQTNGRVETITQQVPLVAAQQGWQEAVSQCENTNVNIPIYDEFQACRDLNVTPTNNQCISVGRINLNNYGIQCCTSFVPFTDIRIFEPFLNANSSNPCGSFASLDTWTVADARNQPGGGAIPSSIDIPNVPGAGIGPRPTQAPPPEPFTVGALVTQTTTASGGIEFRAGPGADGNPGTVDVHYETNARLRTDTSAVAPGDTFRLFFEHAPAPFNVGNGSGSTMRSVFPPESIVADYQFELGVEITAEVWNMNPRNGEQLYADATVFDGTFSEGGTIASASFISDEALEFRFFDGVDGAPEEFRDVVFRLDEEDIPYLNPFAPGMSIGMNFTAPGECPFEDGIDCPGVDIPDSQPASVDIGGLKLTVPVVNTPVPPDFSGGTEEQFGGELLVPKRHAIEGGILINSAPNGFRPVLNFTDQSFKDAVSKDSSVLSSDKLRVEADVDGLLGLSNPVLKAGVNLAVGELVSLSLDIADLDAIFWNAWDQTLRFDPRLKADITFSEPVDVTFPDGTTDAGVTALTLEVLSIDTGLSNYLDVVQPAGGVDVSVTYSFRDNEFENETLNVGKIGGQLAFLNLGLGGFVGTVFGAASFPTEFSPLRFTFEAPEPIFATPFGGSATLTGDVTDYAGTSLRIVDLTQDTDRDGIANDLEIAGCTSELDVDSDDDGLGDGIEDANRNGVVDAGESSPCLFDSDGDGIGDGVERGLTTAIPDPDGAGPLAGTNLGVFIADVTPTTTTNPAAADTDGDGLSDSEEDALGTDPVDSDSDNDGLLDGYEIANGFDPLVGGDGDLDSDNDGLTNTQEQDAGTNPFAADTDGDGLLDAFEVEFDFNPLVAGEAELDADQDALTNAQEQDLGTSPRERDSDGDYMSDGDEVMLTATSPLVAQAFADLLVTERDNNAIVRVNLLTGERTLVANNATIGSVATLDRPIGLAVERAGTILVANLGGDELLRVFPLSGVAEVVSGDAQPGPALGLPVGLVIADSRTAYLADQGSVDRVVRIDLLTGERTLVANLPGPPLHIALEADGNLLVSDTFNNAVRRVNVTTGSVTTAIAGVAARGVAVERSGRVWVAQENVVTLHEVDGALVNSFAMPANGIRDAVTLSDGGVFVASWNTDEILHASVGVAEAITVSGGTEEPVLGFAEGLALQPVLDSDNDGLPDLLELELGSDPQTADTDADGVLDGADNCLFFANPTQDDTDGDSYGNACDADFNNDCVVNVVDLGQLRANFFSTEALYDLNGDGVVNVVDLGRVRATFFQKPGPSASTDLCD